LKNERKDILPEEGDKNMRTRLGLNDLGRKLPGEKSGGQKQRVAIAKAVCTNPPIILANVPTRSLDTDNAMEVMKILQEQTKNRNKTCIIVTHDERLTAYCDKIYHMNDGILTLK